MKFFFITLILLATYVFALAQQLDIERLTYRYNHTTNDTLRMVVADSLSDAYSEIKPDSSIYYADITVKLSRQLEFRLNEALGLNMIGYIWLNRGNYTNALKVLLSALQLCEDPQSEKNILPEKYILTRIISFHMTPLNYRLLVTSNTHFHLGLLYENTSNIEKGLFHYSQSMKLGEQIGDKEGMGFACLNLGRLYVSQNKTDSALLYIQRAYEISRQVDFAKFSGSCLLNLGRVYLASGNKQLAVEYFHNAIAVCQEEKYYRGLIAANLMLADINMKDRKTDSGYYFSVTALQKATELNVPDLLLRSYTSMADHYNRVNNSDSLVKYQKLIIKIKDSIYSSGQVQQFQNLDFNEQQRQQEMMATKKEYQNRLQKYLLLSGLGVVLIVALILFRNNRQKQKTNRVLEKTLSELRSTQSQLIQSEKMASLGELTAGIAHEIQNPLNFVNNFSEVNSELISEMKQEIDKGNLNEVKSIAADIDENEQKIIFHGKKADAIVKGMLQHSRTGGGVKEPTNINALTDEYLRLAYHGMRAKDKSFNITIKIDFDESIGKINIVPQDIGRVVLNLLNNAFYSVKEKQKQNLNPHLPDEQNYEPTVTISTVKQNGKVEIKVKDNGNGIPQKILDKVFQPFFTTKPTGQGTGLGLSLGYDIVKAHGGELKMQTREGEGAEFIIHLPASIP